MLGWIYILAEIKHCQIMSNLYISFEMKYVQQVWNETAITSLCCSMHITEPVWNKNFLPIFHDCLWVAPGLKNCYTSKNLKIQIPKNQLSLGPHFYIALSLKYWVKSKLINTILYCKSACSHGHTFLSLSSHFLD